MAVEIWVNVAEIVGRIHDAFEIWNLVALYEQSVRRYGAISNVDRPGLPERSVTMYDMEAERPTSCYRRDVPETSATDARR